MDTTSVDLAAIDVDRAVVALKDTRFYLKPENGGHDLFIRHFAAKDKGAYEKGHFFKGRTYNCGPGVLGLLSWHREYLGRRRESDKTPESVGYVTCRLKPNAKGKISNAIDCFDGSDTWVFEYDSGSKEDQLRWYAATGLPLQLIDSGNKSIHAVLRTVDVVPSMERWEHIRDLLWEALVRTIGEYPDPQAMKSVQVMRLPGSVHPSTGRFCEVIHDPGTASLTSEQFEAGLQKLNARGEHDCRMNWRQALQRAEAKVRSELPVGKRRKAADDATCAWEQLIAEIDRPTPWSESLALSDRQQVVKEALAAVPPRVPGQGDQAEMPYEQHMKLLAGITRYLGEDHIGWIVDAVNEHSPEWTEVDENKLRGFLDRPDGFNMGSVLTVVRDHLKDELWIPPTERQRRENRQEWEEMRGLVRLNAPGEYLEFVWPLQLQGMCTPGANVTRVAQTARAQMKGLRLDPEAVMADIPARLGDLAGLPKVNRLDVKRSNGIRSMQEWARLSRGRTERTFAVPGFLVKNGINLIVGQSGGGKTIQALFMLLAMIKGEPFGDSKEPAMKLKPGEKLLVISNDRSESGVNEVMDNIANADIFSPEEAALLHDRIEIWGKQTVEGEVYGDNFHFSPGQVMELIEKLRSGSYPLFLLDSLKRSCTLSELGASIYDTSVVKWIQLLERCCRTHEVTAFIAMHTNKSHKGVNGVGGVTDLVEIVNTAHLLETKGVDPDCGRFTVTWEVLKGAGTPKRRFDMSRDVMDGKTVVMIAQGDARLSSVPGDLYQLIQTDGGVTAKDLYECLKRSGKAAALQTIKDHLTRLYTEGKIGRTGGVGRAPAMYYPLGHSALEEEE